MDFKKAFKDFIFFGSTYFTAITVVILAVASSLSDAEAVQIIETSQFFKILLFAFLMSLGSTLLRVESIPRVAAVCLHAACYVLGFLLFFILAYTGKVNESGTAFALTAIATLLFAIVYVVTTVIVRTFTKKKAPVKSAPKVEKKEKPSKKKDYVSQFK